MRGSMRLAGHRLGARALRAPGGRVAALEWSQMASARRAAGRPGGCGRGPPRLREVCHAVPWCTFLCMDCAGGRCGRGWRGERPSRDLRERASHRAAAKRACCERRIVSTQELLAALPSCTRSACRAHADTCTCVTVRDRGAREYGRLRAPRTGVLDLEAARSYHCTAPTGSALFRAHCTAPTGSTPAAYVHSTARTDGALQFSQRTAPVHGSTPAANVHSTALPSSSPHALP